jgi:hypothetical protein
MAIQKAMQMGPIDRVPCPWCGKPMDLRPFMGEVDFLGSRDFEIICDDPPRGCGRKSLVAKIDKRPRVVLKRK